MELFGVWHYTHPDVFLGDLVGAPTDLGFPSWGKGGSPYTLTSALNPGVRGAHDGAVVRLLLAGWLRPRALAASSFFRYIILPFRPLEFSLLHAKQGVPAVPLCYFFYTPALGVLASYIKSRVVAPTPKP